MRFFMKSISFLFGIVSLASAIMWKLNYIDEPTVAVIGSILTILSLVISNKIANKSKDRENRIEQYNVNGDNISGDKIINNN
jgi:hypothetical protein